MRSDRIVIYNTQTGFTKKYAEWLSEALECECVECSGAEKMDLDRYETIIFGGWACAGSISKLKWFQNKMKKWENKKLAVYCVGGSPMENPDVEEGLKNCLRDVAFATLLSLCPRHNGFNVFPVRDVIGF